MHQRLTYEIIFYNKNYLIKFIISKFPLHNLKKKFIVYYKCNSI